MNLCRPGRSVKLEYWLFMSGSSGSNEPSPLELATPSKIEKENNLIEFEVNKEIKSDKISDDKENIELKVELLQELLEKVQTVQEKLVDPGTQEKESTKELIKVPVRIGTRSQKVGTHQVLEFPKRTKMAEQTMNWEEARKFIPLCKEEKDVDNFIDACEIAINTVETKQVPHITKYIVTRIAGDIHQIIKNKDVSEWKLIKGYLKEAFEDQYTASALQAELNSMKLRQGEKVKDYSRKVENIYYKLVNIQTAGKIESAAKVLREALREQTLSAYIRGLPYTIRTIVKSRNPTTFDQAKQMALSEEMEIGVEQIDRQNFRNQNFNNNRTDNQRNISRNNNNNFNKFNSKFGTNQNRNNFNNTNRNNNRQPIRCYRCNGDHYASQCRNNRSNTYNNNNPPNRNNYNNRNNAHFTRPPANSNNDNRALICSYCNKIGHKTDECYKKLNDEHRNQTQNINFTETYQDSGNSSESDVPRGTRSIGQLAAQLSDNVSTLSLQ